MTAAVAVPADHRDDWPCDRPCPACNSAPGPEAPQQITEPGVYDIPCEHYLADPVPGGSLSVSGARKLLPPSCPARYRWELDHQPTPTAAFDLGHAAHTLVLGNGPEIIAVDAEDWRTKAARAARDDARESGAVALLAHEHEQVLAMAGALKAHPVASALLDPRHGRPEQSLFWVDPATGVWRRARVDWLPDSTPDRRMLLADYKTTKCAAPDALQRAAYEYGYHQQAPWYLDGAAALGWPADTAFLFIFQEKTPPYLVTVIELDVVAMHIGRKLNRLALETYAQCAREDRWPGYSDEVELVRLPGWVEYRYSEDLP